MHFYNVFVADEGFGFNASEVLLVSISCWRTFFLLNYRSYHCDIFLVIFCQYLVLKSCILLPILFSGCCFFSSLPVFFQLCNIPSLPLVSVPFQGSTFILGDALFMPLGGNSLWHSLYTPTHSVIWLFVYYTKVLRHWFSVTHTFQRSVTFLLSSPPSLFLLHIFLFCLRVSVCVHPNVPHLLSFNCNKKPYWK